MTDIGTGSYTILTQIASEMLGVSPRNVRMELGDTAYPMASGSGGSFGAASSGSGLFDACMHLRAKLARAAGMDPAAASFADGNISFGGVSKPLMGLVGDAGIEADGSIQPGATLKDYSQQSYGAQFAEVGVDMDTGEIRLRRMLGVFTAGRILNAKTARSQAIGGMIFGVSAALEEDVVLDKRYGMFVNNDLARVSCARACRHSGCRCDLPAGTRQQGEPAEKQRHRRTRHLRRWSSGGECGLQRVRHTRPGLSDHAGQGACGTAVTGLTPGSFDRNRRRG